MYRPSQLPRPKAVLTIAGSDSSGGAGIQADMKTILAYGLYPVTAITAVTAQNTQGVSAITTLSASDVAEQINAVMTDINVDAIKIGMLPNPDVVTAIAQIVQHHRTIPVVLDPVMVATSGDRLVTRETIAAMVEQLCPLATIVTPNLPEATILAKKPLQDHIALGQQLLKTLASTAVLIKDGHGQKTMVNDTLVTCQGHHIFTHPRLTTNNTHGSGCTLSSAIACGLANQQPVIDAVTDACCYVHQAIANAQKIKIGHGNGPLNHFFRYPYSASGD